MHAQVPWRWEALLRLFAGVLTCVLIGSWLGLLGVSYGSPQGVRIRWLALPGLGGLLVALALTWRPWPWEAIRSRLVGFSVSFYLGLGLLSLAHQWIEHSKDDPPGYQQVVLAGLSFQGATLILITKFLREHQIPWHRAFGLNQHPGRAAFMGVAAGTAALLPAWTLQILSGTVLQKFHQETEVQVAVQVLQTTTGWLPQLALAAVAIGLAPVAEEALFRGLLFRTLYQANFRRLAWIGSSLLFAWVHAHVTSFVALVFLSLWLTWLYNRTGNLLAPIVAHAVFNALNFAALQVYQRGWNLP
ncbi:MAG: type II CAAX endopeptidase family protein [Verrucomicrobiota bacterium]|nr:CPBP family intramembrane metalloprotease [Limisphaera sp.]MDW8381423.1 type II CAAX endopeptidase family protein [Verrucomicrobiota bacterium]